MSLLTESHICLFDFRSTKKYNEYKIRFLYSLMFMEASQRIGVSLCWVRYLLYGERVGERSLFVVKPLDGFAFDKP